jgi:hypothetical protein
MAPAFAYMSLYDRPSVHYRDETDIYGLVAPCDHLITSTLRWFTGTQSVIAIESR